MQHQTMIPMWNVQLYSQGDFISSEIIEEAEVQSMTQHFERKGYEVRSEPAWKRIGLRTLGDNHAKDGRGVANTDAEVRGVSAAHVRFAGRTSPLVRARCISAACGQLPLLPHSLQADSLLAIGGDAVQRTSNRLCANRRTQVGHAVRRVA